MKYDDQKPTTIVSSNVFEVHAGDIPDFNLNSVPVSMKESSDGAHTCGAMSSRHSWQVEGVCRLNRSAEKQVSTTNIAA